MVLTELITIVITGLNQLREEIGTSTHGEASINTLCKTQGGKIVLVALRAATPLHEITAKYDVMARLHRSSLFVEMWNTHMRRASRAQSKLSIQSIRTDIWDPCFHECQILLKSLCDKTILLGDVDCIFKSIKDIEELRTNLLTLQAGVKHCVSDIFGKKDVSHLRDAVNRIEKYRSLCRVAAAAKVVMDLTQKLTLTGDFTVIQDLAKVSQITFAGGEGNFPPPPPLGNVNEILIWTIPFVGMLIIMHVLN